MFCTPFWLLVKLAYKKFTDSDLSESMLSFLVTPFRTRAHLADQELTTPTTQAPLAQNNSALDNPFNPFNDDVEMNAAFHTISNPFRQSTPDQLNPTFHSVIETSF